MDGKNNGDDFTENRADKNSNDDVIDKILNNGVIDEGFDEKLTDTENRRRFIINALLQLKTLLTGSEINLENTNFEELKTAIYLHTLLYACDDRSRPTGLDPTGPQEDDTVAGILFGLRGKVGSDRVKMIRNNISHGDWNFKILEGNTIAVQEEVFDSKRLENIFNEFCQKNKDAGGGELKPYKIIVDISKGKLSPEHLKDPTVRLALFDLLTNLLVNYTEQYLYPTLDGRLGTIEDDSHPLIALLAGLFKSQLDVFEFSDAIPNELLKSENDPFIKFLRYNSSPSKSEINGPIEIDCNEILNISPNIFADIHDINHTRNSVTHHYRALSSDDIILWDYKSADRGILTGRARIPFKNILDFLKNLDRDKLEEAIGELMDLRGMNIPHTPVQMPFDDEQIADAITALKNLNLDLDKYFHGDGEGDGEKGDDGEKDGHDGQDGQDDPR